MELLFGDPPSGEFNLQWLWDIDTRVEQIEQRLAALAVRIAEPRD